MATTPAAAAAIEKGERESDCVCVCAFDREEQGRLCCGASCQRIRVIVFETDAANVGPVKHSSARILVGSGCSSKRTLGSILFLSLSLSLC